MSPSASPEREQPARARREEDASTEESTPKKEATQSARSAAAVVSENVGQRFWALPTTSGTPLVVMEENDPWAMSEALRVAQPIVLTPGSENVRKSADGVREKVQSSLTDR